MQEQIASALAEESQPEPALLRYEALAKTSRDPYRQVQFRIEAAELKVRLGRRARRLRDFEGLLGELDPESWVVPRGAAQIEEVFLSNDDQAGLASYYEKWLKKTPDDVEAMARLGRTLASQGGRRGADLVRQRGQARPLAEGPEAGLDRPARPGAEIRRGGRAVRGDQPVRSEQPRRPARLGPTVLRDTSRSEAGRKQAAAAVWNRLLDSRPATRQPPLRSPTCSARRGSATRRSRFMKSGRAGPKVAAVP